MTMLNGDEHFREDFARRGCMEIKVLKYSDMK